jgi:DNA replication protein DnaC
MQLQELALSLDDVIGRDGDTRAMIDSVRQAMDWPGGFWTVWGGVGNGKTLILMAVINELRESRGLVGAYVRFKDLLDYIRAGFDDVTGEGSERQRYEFLRGVDVLAVDEVDKVRLTEYTWEFRTAFFDDRYRMAITGRALTLFAMNSDPAELPDDIYDRMRDGRFTIHHNSDTSFRPAMVRGGH